MFLLQLHKKLVTQTELNAMIGKYVVENFNSPCPRIFRISVQVIVVQDVSVDKCAILIVAACLLTGLGRSSTKYLEEILSLCPMEEGYSEDDGSQENDVHHV